MPLSKKELLLAQKAVAAREIKTSLSPTRKPITALGVVAHSDQKAEKGPNQSVMNENQLPVLPSTSHGERKHRPLTRDREADSHAKSKENLLHNGNVHQNHSDNNESKQVQIPKGKMEIDALKNHFP